LTASTGIDALTHAIEGMLHKNAHPFSDMFCVTAIEMVMGYLRRAVVDGEDIEARYHMSMAATLGITGLNMTGALYAHSVSNVLPMYKFTPHGVGCGLGLPYMMNYNVPVRTEKLAKMAAIMGEPTWMLSGRDAAELAVNSVAKLIKDVGLPLTLKEYGGIEENDLDKMADQMITKFHRPMNPRPMGKEESIQFWHNMWEGIY